MMGAVGKAWMLWGSILLGECFFISGASPLHSHAARANELNVHVKATVRLRGHLGRRARVSLDHGNTGAELPAGLCTAGEGIISCLEGYFTNPALACSTSLMNICVYMTGLDEKTVTGLHTGTGEALSTQKIDLLEDQYCNDVFDRQCGQSPGDEACLPLAPDDVCLKYMGARNLMHLLPTETTTTTTTTTTAGATSGASSGESSGETADASTAATTTTTTKTTTSSVDLFNTPPPATTFLPTNEPPPTTTIYTSLPAVTSTTTTDATATTTTTLTTTTTTKKTCCTTTTTQRCPTATIVTTTLPAYSTIHAPLPIIQPTPAVNVEASDLGFHFMIDSIDDLPTLNEKLEAQVKVRNILQRYTNYSRDVFLQTADGIMNPDLEQAINHPEWFPIKVTFVPTPEAEAAAKGVPTTAAPTPVMPAYKTETTNAPNTDTTAQATTPAPTTTPDPSVAELPYSAEWQEKLGELIQAKTAELGIDPTKLDISMTDSQGNALAQGVEPTEAQFPLTVKLSPEKKVEFAVAFSADWQQQLGEMMKTKAEETGLDPTKIDVEMKDSDNNLLAKDAQPIEAQFPLKVILTPEKPKAPTTTTTPEPAAAEFVVPYSADWQEQFGTTMQTKATETGLDPTKLDVELVDAQGNVLAKETDPTEAQFPLTVRLRPEKGATPATEAPTVAPAVAEVVAEFSLPYAEDWQDQMGATMEAEATNAGVDLGEVDTELADAQGNVIAEGTVPTQAQFPLTIRLKTKVEQAATTTTPAAPVKTVVAEFSVPYSEDWQDTMGESMQTNAANAGVDLESVDTELFDAEGNALASGTMPTQAQFPITVKLTKEQASSMFSILGAGTRDAEEADAGQKDEVEAESDVTVQERLEADKEAGFGAPASLGDE